MKRRRRGRVSKGAVAQEKKVKREEEMEGSRGEVQVTSKEGPGLYRGEGGKGQKDAGQEKREKQIRKERRTTLYKNPRETREAPRRREVLLKSRPTAGGEGHSGNHGDCCSAGRMQTAALSEGVRDLGSRI